MNVQKRNIPQQRRRSTSVQAEPRADAILPSGGMPMSAQARVPEVEVGPFWVSDSPCGELVDHLVDLTLTATAKPAFAYALHVGGLNARRERDFVVAMRQGDVVYADGGSVVWLARLAGADRIERAPTTDIGWELLRGFAARTGRAPRVALVGGPDGLAERAGAVLQAAGVAEIVHTDHGFHDDWSGPLARLREVAPDISVIGLGAPREMVWSQQHRDDLPPSLVLTCGGWFGHLVGDEKRAPVLLRRSGLEWIARVAQAPQRLGPRYAKGAGATAVLAMSTLRRRSRS
ncbi:WecB/TagA/CpsF family glycosyltransferase [Marmoricola sp. URHB0036]|uniref:WecB/TagA/CpsF family glycosyltransferase n=1 Tax=Marmoricola sp. URHB0036 TaxID=1298863 RepID=UPI000422D1CE|nr:WecB/TagA/CpsF family glycosyltransferase [Marmoricola sp. URHB0036]